MLNIMKGKGYLRLKMIIIVIMILFAVSLCYICYSYFYTQGSFSISESSISILEFSPLVNSSSNNNQSIDLSSTITNNKNLAPGAQGKFKVEIDFSSVESDSYYRLTYDRTGIPNNLKFYFDEDYTAEFSSLEGTIYANHYNNQIAEHYVYWKWIVDDSEASNENDSLYMGQNISVVFTAYISQMVEKNTIKVNNEEKSTGRIYISGTHTGGNKGAFNISLDLSNATSNSQYRIYFNEKELSNALHLYSDSGYQNEINYIQGVYDGVNNNITSTVYWKLDSGSISSLYNGLYYVVVFGSW